MASDIKYEIILYWSQSDQVANAQEAIQERIETAKELGRPIPPPRGRSWLGCGVVLCLVLGAGFVLWLGTFTPPISQASCDRIKKGMTPEQVAEVMGCPPGLYCRKGCYHRQIFEFFHGSQVAYTGTGFVRKLSGPGDFGQFWVDEYRYIMVAFEEGSVAYAIYCDNSADLPNGIFDRVRAALRW
jgi:hypothetical protein